MMKRSLILPAVAAGLLLPVPPSLVGIAKPAIIKPAKDWVAHEKMLLANFLPGMMPSWNRAAASSFIPLSLFASSERGGWYDSADTATLFQNSGGTGAVSSNGDPIGYWGDKSGNGNHATQGTAGFRPLFSAFGPAFDGADDSLARADLTATLANTTLWAVAVFNVSSYTDAYGRILSLSASSGVADHNGANRCAAILRNNTASAMIGFRNGSASTSSVTVNTGTKYIIESKWDGTNHTMTANGSAAGTWASSGSFAIDSMKMGQEINNTTGKIAAAIAELIFIDKIPTAQEVLDCREYLRAKWSVY